MARKSNIQNMIGSLLSQISGEIARGVTQGIERSGLLGTLKKAASVSGKTKTGGKKRGAKKKKPTNCSVKGCNLPARTKGLCTKHYQQKRYAELKKKGTDKTPVKRPARKPAKKTATKTKSIKKKAADKKVKADRGNCKMAGCTNPVHARELCGRHFMEWVRSRKS